MSSGGLRASRTPWAKLCGSSASICCPCRQKSSSWPRPVSPWSMARSVSRCAPTGTSTPLQPCTRAQGKLLPTYVEIWQERKCVARHERSFLRYQQVLDLEHYLDVLEREPGALAGSSPLAQWRQRGRWPESFDRLWQSLRERCTSETGCSLFRYLLRPGHGRQRCSVIR